MKAICFNPCVCLVTACSFFLTLPLSWVETLPPTPATLRFPHGLSSITCSETSTWQCSFQCRLLTSAPFNSCASSNTSSTTCAPHLQHPSPLMLGNTPDPPFSTVQKLSHQSIVLLQSFCNSLSCSCCANQKLPFQQQRFTRTFQQSLLASLRHLSTDVPSQTLTAATGALINFTTHIKRLICLKTCLCFIFTSFHQVVPSLSESSQ